MIETAEQAIRESAHRWVDRTSIDELVAFLPLDVFQQSLVIAEGGGAGVSPAMVDTKNFHTLSESALIDHLG